MRPRKVAVATANRAERGILEPVIRRLRFRDDVRFDLVEPKVAGSRTSWDETFTIWHGMGKPDVLLVPADRKEMVELATRAYYDGIPIVHLWAGSSYSGSWDDLNRRTISGYAYLMLCEDEQARDRLAATGEDLERIIVTGTPHYDDLEIDEKLCPKGSYDLVLLNPNPVDVGDYLHSFEKVKRMLVHDRQLVWIGPNEGEVLIPGDRLVKFYPSLPRPEFLGLLKKCTRFISNSSATVFEAPLFDCEVVNPGKRNALRTTRAPREPGASDRIVELLATYDFEKERLLKEYYRVPQIQSAASG